MWELVASIDYGLSRVLIQLWIGCNIKNLNLFSTQLYTNHPSEHLISQLIKSHFQIYFHFLWIPKVIGIAKTVHTRYSLVKPNIWLWNFERFDSLNQGQTGTPKRALPLIYGRAHPGSLKHKNFIVFYLKSCCFDVLQISSKS